MQPGLFSTLGMHKIAASLQKKKVALIFLPVLRDPNAEKERRLHFFLLLRTENLCFSPQNFTRKWDRVLLLEDTHIFKFENFIQMLQRKSNFNRSKHILPC